MPDLWTPENASEAYLILDQDRRLAGAVHEMGRKEIDYYHELEPLEFPSARLYEYMLGPVCGLRSNIERRQIEAAWTPKQRAMVEQGRVLSVLLGGETGLPIKPREVDIREGEKHGLVPNEYQIISEFDSLFGYNEAVGFVLPETVRGWSDEKWVANYRWLKIVLSKAGHPTTSLKKMLKTAVKLHVGPSIEMAEEFHGSLSGYAVHVEHKSPHNKRILTREGLRRAAIDTVLSNGGAIRKENIIAGRNRWLGRSNTENNFGGVEPLNLSLGIISGTRHWDKNMHLWWGVTRFMPTRGRTPGRVDLERASANHQGPSLSGVHHNFNNSLREYESELNNAKLWFIEQVQKLSRTTGEQEGLNRSIVAQAMIQNPQLFHVGSDVEPSELSILYRAQAAGVDLHILKTCMQDGISFKHPWRDLNVLAGELETAGMLNSGVLKQLEPYIVGLAPPRANMSWSDFIATYRSTKAKARREASSISATV